MGRCAYRLFVGRGRTRRGRRRWAASEKIRMVEETFEPGMTVGLVARRHGVAPNQLFTRLL